MGESVDIGHGHGLETAKKCRSRDAHQRNFISGINIVAADVREMPGIFQRLRESVSRRCNAARGRSYEHLLKSVPMLQETSVVAMQLWWEYLQFQGTLFSRVVK
ncbi:hypothetical protein AVEN_26029-1 [Araneus ventricosus]|uniref:Uncharacterized protein n=1 Tax=Araneus ventricosus TaxID=182803 RepID=A0A4Y2E3P9_ARAVE|nr:hypothetical protein AVEN_26029-1 [Araneus ventricosus]